MAKTNTIPGSIQLFAASADLKVEAAAKGEDDKNIRKFSGVAYTGVKMRANGFFYPVVVDLSGLTVSSKSRPILRDHDAGKIVGHTDSITKSSRSVEVSGLISGANDHGEEVISLSDNEFPWQMSIGASVDRAVFLDEDEESTVNGRLVVGPAYIVRQSSLNEISFVALGADDDTSAKVAATAASQQVGVLTMEFEKWLKAKGWEDGADLSEGQMKSLRAMFDAENAVAASSEDDNLPPVKAKKKTREDSNLADFVEAKRKDRDRIEKIELLAQQEIDNAPWLLTEINDLAAAACEEKTSVERFELELLRATRPDVGTAGKRRSSGQKEMTNGVLEASICMAGGLSDVEKKFDERTLDLAHKHYPHGVGLQELLVLAARENGYQGFSASNVREVLQYAFRSDVRASGFSTVSLPGILSNTANKFLVDAFNAVEQEWSKIAATRSVRNFQQISSYSLTGNLEYEEIGSDGEIKHGTLGEETYTNQAETYAKMLAITRRDIINDDLGAFAAIPRKLGRGAALKLNKVFWTVFLDNDTFFTAPRGNFSDDAGTVFTTDSLIAADVMFKAQVDPDSNPLGSMPRILLVPPALDIPAKRLMSSQKLLETTNAGETNPLAGMFRVVSSQYLSQTALGGSAIEWYLLADPNDIPVIEVAFLNGRTMPVIESAEADFNTLGIQMRGYHDFGVAKQEYRGGVKFAGTAASTS